MVQGVGFRWTARETARQMGLSGWVRNIDDGSVDCEVEGEEDVLHYFRERMKSEFQRYIRDEEVSCIAAAGDSAEFKVKF
jgi:acylphosphatase